MSRIPAIVLGATGYVGGELLRLIAQHSHFELAAAVSREPGDASIAATFPHLAPAYPDTPFVAVEAALERAAGGAPVAVFSALPHGHAAATLARFAELGNDALHIVDVSADYRFDDLAVYERIYGAANAAPSLAPAFTAALPELAAGTPTPHVAHPGCFATAMLLAAAPLAAADLVTGDVFITGITGSTGSGKTPLATTHHPVRHANLYAYKPLAHRHAPEVESVIRAATGRDINVHFVPHSGPIARGIIVNLQARLAHDAGSDELLAAAEQFYAHAPFVSVKAGGVRLRNVVASNYAELSIASDGATVAVCVVIDNLVKGAAGGAVQWMNRLHSLDETTGLTAPASGWA